MNTAFLPRVRQAALVFVLATAQSVLAQSPISYQGRLAQQGEAANGHFAFRFLLYDAQTNGQVLHVQENLDIFVTNGLFRAELTPAETIIGTTPLWLEIAVRPADLPEVPFATLRPRQQLTYVPNAIYARKAGTVAEGSVTSQSLAEGAVTPEKLVSGFFGAGLTLQNNSVEVAFAEGGTASTVARGDHRHFGQRWEGPVLFGEAGLEVVNTDSGAGNGLYGESMGAGGSGIKGVGFSRGVTGFSVGGFGVAGETIGGTAVYGNNGNSDTDGHAGYFNGRVRITQGLSVGGAFSAQTSSEAIGSRAILGLATATDGFASGLWGETTAPGGYGLRAINRASGGTGAYVTGIGYGVRASGGTTGVEGNSSEGFGVSGTTTTGTGVYGSNGNSDTGGHAGYFDGRVRVTQSLNVSRIASDDALEFHVLGGTPESVRALRIEPGVSWFGFATANIIAGSPANYAQSNVFGAAIGGGGDFTLPNRVEGPYGTVSGGYGNSAAEYAVAAGGRFNHANAIGSFAAGHTAVADHLGAFVWANTSRFGYNPFRSSRNYQFAVRAGGGFYLDTEDYALAMEIRSEAPLGTWLTLSGVAQWSLISSGEANGEGAGKLLFHDGNVTRMQLDNGGLRVNGTFVSSSDRNIKENFSTISNREVLQKVCALPISSWNYKEDKTQRHIGPMAQDFYAAFKVGPDDKHIASVDADGVALAAIQGLSEIVREKDAELQKLKERNESLEKRLAALERLVTSLAAAK
jgi:trimeric autotransporter adhesin